MGWSGLFASRRRHHSSVHPVIHVSLAQYCEAFVNGSLLPGHTESTAYTSLLRLHGAAPPTYVLQYDRLADGWSTPPGDWGARDTVFSMRFTI